MLAEAGRDVYVSERPGCRFIHAIFTSFADVYVPLNEKTKLLDSSMPRRITRTDTFHILWIFVSGIITQYLYLPEAECVDSDKPTRTAKSNLGRDITQSP